MRTWTEQQLLEALNRLQRYDMDFRSYAGGVGMDPDDWGDYIKAEGLAAALGLVLDGPFNDDTGTSRGYTAPVVSREGTPAGVGATIDATIQAMREEPPPASLVRTPAEPAIAVARRKPGVPSRNEMYRILKERSIELQTKGDPNED